MATVDDGTALLRQHKKRELKLALCLIPYPQGGVNTLSPYCSHSVGGREGAPNRFTHLAAVEEACTKPLTRHLPIAVSTRRGDAILIEVSAPGIYTRHP
jgi:hypothetical protein